MENCTLLSSLMDNHGTLTQMEATHNHCCLSLNLKLRKLSIVLFMKRKYHLKFITYACYLRKFLTIYNKAFLFLTNQRINPVEGKGFFP